MSFDIVITLLVLASVICTLAVSRISADLIMMAAVAILLILGVITPDRAFEGFSNPGVIVIATLYVVSAGVIETGAVQWVASLILGKPKKTNRAQLRIFLPTSILSAFMNNTAVVAMFIPAVQQWADRLKIPASKLLLPLSYAAILGGTCSLIGTSTNLIVYGAIQKTNRIDLGLFDIALVGLPITIVGLCFLYLFGDRLLPNRMSAKDQISELRQYCVQFMVNSASPLIGQSIEDAGLRSLNAGYLIEVERDGDLHTAVSPDWVLQDRDVLVFIGAPELAGELRSIRGIVPADHDVAKLGVSSNNRSIVEVVLSADFPGIGDSVKNVRFRTRYKAVILSISRGGERIPGKLGDIALKVGDTLLLETTSEFVQSYQFRKDFLLVSAINNSSIPEFERAPRAILILCAMILSTVLGWTTILESAMLAAGAMFLTRCVNVATARRQIDIQVIVVIAGAFGLGAAMSDSGAAAMIADTVLPQSIENPLIALAIVYVLTVLFTEVVTNNAAAILMIPIAQSYSERLEVSILPFAFAIMIAASASFMTPLGYQTNLMVYGPGQYRYLDYLKLGLPLSILVAVISLVLINMWWPF